MFFFNGNQLHYMKTHTINQHVLSLDVNYYETIMFGRVTFTRCCCKCGRALCLPYNYSVRPFSVVHWHCKSEYNEQLMIMVQKTHKVKERARPYLQQCLVKVTIQDKWSHNTMPEVIMISYKLTTKVYSFS